MAVARACLKQLNGDCLQCELVRVFVPSGPPRAVGYGRQAAPGALFVSLHRRRLCLGDCFKELLSVGDPPPESSSEPSELTSVRPKPS
jgi:hypothetical protein